jgi:hypothetical protein
MGREETCMVSIDAKGWATIQNAPPNLSDGDYELTVPNDCMLFGRLRGRWSQKFLPDSIERRLSVAKHIDN